MLLFIFRQLHWRMVLNFIFSTFAWFIFPLEIASSLFLYSIHFYFHLQNINGSNTSSDAAIPTSIYPAVHYNSQGQAIDAVRSPGVAYGNNLPSYPSGSFQGVHLTAAGGQCVNQFENSSVEATMETKEWIIGISSYWRR